MPVIMPVMSHAMFIVLRCEVVCLVSS